MKVRMTVLGRPDTPVAIVKKPPRTARSCGMAWHKNSWWQLFWCEGKYYAIELELFLVSRQYA